MTPHTVKAVFLRIQRNTPLTQGPPCRALPFVRPTKPLVIKAPLSGRREHVHCAGAGASAGGDAGTGSDAGAAAGVSGAGALSIGASAVGAVGVFTAGGAGGVITAGAVSGLLGVSARACCRAILTGGGELFAL